MTDNCDSKSGDKFPSELGLRKLEEVKFIYIHEKILFFF